MHEYLDAHDAMELEFILWGLTIIGLYLIVGGLALFARYCYRLYHPAPAPPVPPRSIQTHIFNK
jgi:choline-glycine betaine transporter